MTPVGQPERATQNRVIDLFSGELGYRCLGDWSEREDNSNVEDDILAVWLGHRGHTETQVARTLDLLHREARNPNRSLYDNNKAVYSLLRYGVQVKDGVGENTVIVPLIDWANPQANDFAIAEEVTLRFFVQRMKTKWGSYSPGSKASG